MISFLRNRSLLNIKSKLLLLYILNVVDILFTHLLLSTNCYIEANSLMSEIVQSPLLSFSLKIVLPAFLFSVVFYRMQKAAVRQLKLSNILINSAVMLYALIIISHIVWLLLLLIANFIL